MRFLAPAKGVVLLALAASMPIGGDQAIGVLQLRVVPECLVALSGSSVSTSGSGALSTFEGTIDFTYKIRTSQTGGGALEMMLVRELPAEAPPPSATSAPTLAWTTSLAGPGEARSGSQTFSGASPTAIAVFAARSHSPRQGAPGRVTWTLKDAPACSSPACLPAVRLSIRCM